MREHAGFSDDNLKAHQCPLAALLLDMPPIATADGSEWESAMSSADDSEWVSATRTADDSEWEWATRTADDSEWEWATSSSDDSVWEWAMSCADVAELESAMSCADVAELESAMSSDDVEEWESVLGLEELGLEEWETPHQGDVHHWSASPTAGCEQPETTHQGIWGWRSRSHMRWPHRHTTVHHPGRPLDHRCLPGMHQWCLGCFCRWRRPCHQ